MVEQIKLAVTMDDESLVIKSMVIHDGFRPVAEPTTEAIQDEIIRTLPNAVTWEIITDEDFPKDRIYRESWKMEGGKITYDMEKAKAIHLEKIRFCREFHLEDLDREWMKHTGRGNKKEADSVEAIREQLRNITDTIQPAMDACKDAEELKQTWPFDILPTHPFVFPVEKKK